MEKPYTILWYSISNLLDTSNGAAISNKFILEQLAAMNCKVIVLCTDAMDNESGSVVYDRIVPQVELKSGFLRDFNLDSLHYYVVQTQGKKLDYIQQQDQNNLWNIFVRLLDVYEPDLMMGFAPDLFSLSLRREAQTRGIPCAYALCNASHECFRFPDCDLVFTNSYALASYYERISEHTAKVKHFGVCIDEKRVKAAHKAENPRYITYVNPSHNKGISIFIKTALAFKERHPDSQYRFLIVKNRADYNATVQALVHKNGERFITKENSQYVMSNIDVAEHTEAMNEVYSISKVVMMPSLCNEAWGMVATEANVNGVPVIASNLGGLPEAIGRKVVINDDSSATFDDSVLGGILIDPPQAVKDNNCVVPDDEEIKPYLDALESILADYETYSQKAYEAAQYNACDKSLERLVSMIKPLLEQGRKNKQPHDKSFFLTPYFLRKLHDESRQGSQS
ncbi:glycosyltransferase [Anaerobiospirillum succiniciproducens]|uniref:glycosyltransferase n=1 Tax=Anaerobiospirillum succiniciproducens TaxID=13335 RepID=UPI0029433B47|nr:glycosyltransferase [Anaerobiospirillum succiniciproducens]